MLNSFIKVWFDSIKVSTGSELVGIRGGSVGGSSSNGFMAHRLTELSAHIRDFFVMDGPFDPFEFSACQFQCYKC